MWKSQDTSPNVKIPQPTWLQTPSIVQIKKGITEAAMLILKQTNKQTTTHANKYSIIIMYMMLAFKGKSHSQIKKSTISSADRYPSLALLTARLFSWFLNVVCTDKSLLSPWSILQVHQLRTCFLLSFYEIPLN